MQPRRAALAWIALGHAGMAAWVSDARLTLDPDRAILFEGWPIHLRVGLWLASALVVALGAANPRWETVAFAAAVVMPIERSIGHLWSWGHHLIPGTPPGDPLGWGPALLWLSIAALTIQIARATRLPREDA